MSARRRLKAALIPAGTLLGDMTCFLSETTESPYYLLGLLNSELMNRRFKLTSANNYLSAEEIASLPIPRLADMEPEGDLYELAVEELARSGEITIASLSAHPVLHARPEDEIPRVLRRLIVECAMLITASGEVWNAESSEPLIRLADHLTLMLFGAESLAGMIE
jgi:hypothetical protein